MTYDFTTLPDRWDTGAEKYELMKKRCPDVPRGTVPFSVADMDFLPPPELSEGVQDFMRGRVFGYTRTPREYIAAFQRWTWPARRSCLLWRTIPPSWQRGLPPRRLLSPR